jgi:hypothetical protein
MSQRSNGNLGTQQSTAGIVKVHSAEVRCQAAKSERTEHVRCGTGMFGAATGQRVPTVNRSKPQSRANVAHTDQ